MAVTLVSQKNADRVHRMRIITCNLDQPLLAKMKRLTTEFCVYPSRSELVRAAIRAFLIEETSHYAEYKDIVERVNPEQFFFPKDLDFRTIRFDNRFIQK